jgi:hypothetical protein
MNSPVLFSFMLVYNSKNWDKLLSFNRTFITKNKQAITYYHILPQFKRGDCINFVFQTTSEKVDALAKNINESYSTFLEKHKSDSLENINDSNPFLLNYPNNSILFFKNPGFYHTNVNLAGSFRIINNKICKLFEQISNYYIDNVIETPEYSRSWFKNFDALKFSLLLVKRSQIKLPSEVFNRFYKFKSSENLNEETLKILNQKYKEIENELIEFINNIENEQKEINIIESYFLDTNSYLEEKKTNEIIFLIHQIFTLFGLSDQDVIYICYFTESALLKLNNGYDEIGY